jgi:hypothetical protein
MSNKNISGTHFQGPVLGSNKSYGGLFVDVPAAAVEAVRSPYQINLEDFNSPIADGDLAASGWTLTAVTSGTGATEVVDAETGYLLLHPGSVDDAGPNIAYNAAPSATTTASPPLNMLGEIDSTATLMDARELFFQYRVGFSTESATGVWQGKAMFGWLTDSTACMAPGTGVPTLKAEGGIGFHIGEDGVLGVFSQTATLTAAPTVTTGTNVLTDLATVAAADTFVWYTLGFRTRWVDASAGTGVTDFYVNGRKTNTITDGLPMDGTGTYATTFEVLNGPAGLECDMAIDYIVSGITRPGLTYPYSTGAY